MNTSEFRRREMEEHQERRRKAHTPSVVTYARYGSHYDAEGEAGKKDPDLPNALNPYYRSGYRWLDIIEWGRVNFQTQAIHFA